MSERDDDDNEGESSLTKGDKQTTDNSTIEENKSEEIEETKPAFENKEIDKYRKIETSAEQKMAIISKSMPVKLWLENMHWNSNPFTFIIKPKLFVGYGEQTNRMMMAIEERHKFMMVLGPTGSGKTTFLKWIMERLDDEILYISKPPQRPEEFVNILNEKYKRPWYAFWRKNLESIYQVPDFLNKSLGKRHLVVLFDEAHESSTEMLEWLRVLNDQVENMSIVLTGLPAFEDQLRTSLETFAKRVTSKIELLSLTKEETRSLIEKRIKAAGGRGDEFYGVDEMVYEYTGGFPREVIRVCDELINNAILAGRMNIIFDVRAKRDERASAPVQPAFGKMSPMQKEVLEMLSRQPLTPGQIADELQLEKYKTRQHAVRSVNNIVKALYEEGFLERRKEDKAFVYSLAPRISTLFVKR